MKYKIYDCVNDKIDKLSDDEFIKVIENQDEESMSNKHKSIFENITNEEFEKMLEEGGYVYKKVKEGEGGVYVNGKKINSFKELIDMED